MDPLETALVHRVGIARYVQGAEFALNTARCRLCGEVLERTEGPLTIVSIPGLYAVTGAYTENVKVWRVEEPLQSGMKMCITK